MKQEKTNLEKNKAMKYEPLLCADANTDKVDKNGDGNWCINCGEMEMFLSENGLVYECNNCGHWEYSSS